MNFLTFIMIKLIKGYRYIISPILGHSCRYLPTCSEYSIECLQNFGFLKGSYMRPATPLVIPEAIGAPTSCSNNACLLSFSGLHFHQC